MKAYSVDLREKIVKAHLVENYSIRQVSARFSVSKNLVHKLVKQKRTEGNVEPKRRGKPQFSHLTSIEAQETVREIVEQNPDATLAELCEKLAEATGNWVSSTALCRCLQKLGLSRKKKRDIAAKRQRKEYKS